MNADIKLKRYLDDYLDRVFIYSIMLHRAERFYNRLKMLFKMPIILTSASMSIINSNFDAEQMKIVNIIFNILTGVILAVATSWQFEAKQQEFCNAKKKFIKLSCEIEGKLLSNETIDPMYVNTVIDRYNNIEENLDYDIPGFILKSTRQKWMGQKTLPIIINGVEKQEAHRPDNLSLNASPMAVIPEDRALDLERRITDL